MSEGEHIDESFEILSLNSDQIVYDMVDDMADICQKKRFAILLDSATGYKQSTWKEDTKDWVLGKQFIEKTVIGGTLLEALSEKEILVLAPRFEPILNYKVLSSEVSLHCKPKRIRTLSAEEVGYLQAVKSCNDRLEALPKLDWIGSLHIGSGVYLDIPTVFNHPVKVTIRYIGSLPSADSLGTHFGVELLEFRGRGTTDGCFQNYKLFECSQNCGLFVSMEKLTLNEPVVTHQPQQQSRQSPVTDDKPFKKNDRVEAFDVKSSPEIGTVKWIGRNIQALPSGAYIVAIHLDRVISFSDLKSRFPHQISMNHVIETSKNHTTVCLPVYCVKKIESQDDTGGSGGHGHKYDTRFSEQNRSYCNPQDSVTTTIDVEAKRHGISPTAIKENQKEIFKEVEQRKEEARREQEKAESNERRLNMQKVKDELQIGEIEGFDDTMLDRKRQEKILEDLKRQNKGNQQNSSQVGKANLNYPELQQSVPESQSGYQRHQQQQTNHQISQQDPRAQGTYSQDMHPPGMGPPSMGHPGMTQPNMRHPGMTQPGMGHVTQPGMTQPGMTQPGMTQPSMSQPGMGHPGMTQPSMGQQEIYWQNTSQSCMYPPSQNIPSQEVQPQGILQQESHHHGIPQQDIHSQGMFHQQMPQQGAHLQGLHLQGLYPQGMNNSNMSQLDQYQRGVPHNYQYQQYNQPPDNSNWQGKNPQYAMGRQQSFEFNQILRAEANAPDNAHFNDTPQTRPSEPYGQMEASHDMPPLEVGDAIQSGNNPVSYGTIKWIGEIQGSRGLIAGVEMEQPVAGATDGKHDGFQYFECERGKGMFLRLAALRRDDRFIDVKSQTALVRNPLGEFNLNNSIELKTFIQPPEKVVEQVHTGGGKGIQGHQNSCYLDSTLYGLFAFSGAFDDLFLKEATDEIGKTIKSTLQTIVNTLRHDNVVLYNHIMILRDKLDKLQHIKGLKSDEKDPEEFLNLLFKHVLDVEAFLRIKRPFGTDKEFFVQLFVEGDKHHIPKTQDLITEMFKEQQITFAKYPLRLLLQIPRYGKQFKTFKGVIPSLELDVTMLCEQYVGNCIVCGCQGTEFCADCGKQQQLKESVSYFCKECSILWHNHQERKHHKPVSRQPSNDGGDPGRLRLLSVLCIETSHYVCFTRVQGSGTNEWVFFDSMAERPDDVHNVPCVTQCTEQLNEWVYGNKDLTKYTSKELPQLVRRFVEDGYLCIYVDQDGIMYGDDGGTP